MADPLLERIESVRSELIRNPAIASFEFVQALVVAGIGFYRVRARLDNGDLLQLVERFEQDGGNVRVGKYSFHWQDGTGNLIRRWDNAPHHPGISTFPHHVHEFGEANVFAHEPMDVFAVLRRVENEIA